MTRSHHRFPLVNSLGRASRRCLFGAFPAPHRPSEGFSPYPTKSLGPTRLDRLDGSSSGFHDQLGDGFYGDGYRWCAPGLQSDV